MVRVATIDRIKGHRFVWFTRDTTCGVLEPYAEAWCDEPDRFDEKPGSVTWYKPGEALLGRVKLDELAKLVGTVPDNDREIIRYGR